MRDLQTGYSNKWFNNNDEDVNKIICCTPAVECYIVQADLIRNCIEFLIFLYQFLFVIKT